MAALFVFLFHCTHSFSIESFQYFLLFSAFLFAQFTAPLFGSLAGVCAVANGRIECDVITATWLHICAC